MEDCIFCQIVKGKIPSKFLYEDDDVIVINDLHPVAPVHLLVIPKKHIPTLVDITEEDQLLMGKMMLVAKKMADKTGISEKGFKAVFNVKQWGGQSIYHIHLHVVGGAPLHIHVA